MQWWEMAKLKDVESMEKFFSSTFNPMIDKHFPKYEFAVKEGDAIWYTRKLKRQKIKLRRIYNRRRGKGWDSNQFRSVNEQLPRWVH